MVFNSLCLTLTFSLSLSLPAPPSLQIKGCDLIVALTHMRVPNDVRLAKEVPEIHLILGGHDHHYEEKWVSTVRRTESNCDAAMWSCIVMS